MWTRTAVQKQAVPVNSLHCFQPAAGRQERNVRRALSRRTSIAPSCRRLACPHEKKYDQPMGCHRFFRVLGFGGLGEGGFFFHFPPVVSQLLAFA